MSKFTFDLSAAQKARKPIEGHSHTFSGLNADGVSRLIETFGERCRKWDKAQGFATVDFDSEEEYQDWENQPQEEEIDMTRIYLTGIRFSNKEVAKDVARQNGTRIAWEPEKKMWYWEGEGQLPECLKQFSYDTSPEGYRTREKSFNKFLASDAGKRWEEKNEQIMASELGLTVEAYRAEEAAHKERLDRESDEYMQSDEYRRHNEEIEREIGVKK